MLSSPTSAARGGNPRPAASATLDLDEKTHLVPLVARVLVTGMAGFGKSTFSRRRSR